MRLMVIGLARHGKDTFAEVLSDYFGVSYESSSLILAKNVVRPWLEENYGIVYTSLEKCYADRVNHRSKWFEAIQKYNDVPTKLMELVYSKSDIYVGCRSSREFLAGRSQNIFDLAVWVDACERRGITEFGDSNQLVKGDADIVVYNNGTQDEFRRKVIRLWSCLNA